MAVKIRERSGQWWLYASAILAVLIASPSAAIVKCRTADGKIIVGDEAPPGCEVETEIEASEPSAPADSAAASTDAPSSSYEAGFKDGWLLGKTDAHEGRARDGQKAIRLGDIHGREADDSREYANGYHRGYNEGWHAAKRVSGQ